MENICKITFLLNSLQRVIWGFSGSNQDGLFKIFIIHAFHAAIFYMTWSTMLNIEPEKYNLSCLQYYAHHLAVRETFSPFFYGTKLFQQYIVYAYLRVESNNLNFVRQKQAQLRVDSYTGLIEHINS